MKYVYLYTSFSKCVKILIQNKVLDSKQSLQISSHYNSNIVGLLKYYNDSILNYNFKYIFYVK